MGKFPIWGEIVCRQCSSVGLGQFTYGTFQRKLMKKEAEEQGWRFFDDDCFCSEKCLKSIARK